MGAMSNLAAAITNLAEGNEISAEDRTQIRLYLDHMTAQDRQATNAREGEQPTTVKLRDGRVVDVFPSGNVQVYAVDLRSGYELPLPQVRQSTGRVRLIPLG